jgi:hypothetical protein
MAVKVSRIFAAEHGVVNLVAFEPAMARRMRIDRKTNSQFQATLETQMAEAVAAGSAVNGPQSAINE